MYIVSMLVQGVLIVKIILVVIKADMTNQFASLIDRYSNLFVQPFYGLVNSTLEINGAKLPLVFPAALVIYIVASFVLSEVLKTYSRD